MRLYGVLGVGKMRLYGVLGGGKMRLYGVLGRGKMRLYGLLGGGQVCICVQSVRQAKGGWEHAPLGISCYYFSPENSQFQES